MIKHLRIAGVVQGVGYRAAFDRQARALKLSGWVRNRLDGSVEAMVSGNLEAVEKIIEWAWVGPSNAQVNQVSVTDVTDMQALSGGFEILPTA